MKHWLQVEVEEGLWKALRHRAVDAGLSVSEYVRRELFQDGNGKAVEVPSIAPKAVQVASERVKVAQVPVQAKKPSQADCKHTYTIKPEGGAKCVKCGFEP